MKSTFILFVLIIITTGNAQKYTMEDSLRGSITSERNWWDLTYYHLNISVDIKNQIIRGTNIIRYKVLDKNNIMQIDLQPPMNISKITQNGKELRYDRDGNVFYIVLNESQKPGTVQQLEIDFSGKPRIAPNPPWDSGMVWEKDSLGNPFAASVSWGKGSSQWWPCKDHMYDEVDSMRFSINTKKDLIAVGNGKLLSVDTLDNNTRTFHWYTSNSISAYAVNFNIGNYENFQIKYKGEQGPLLCDFYVLKHNIKKAIEHFKLVPKTLEAFEYWFGPYPFYKDNYKLVETPYLGMEHQGAVAYGNQYKYGRLGDLSYNKEWGLKFDYIITHETGHEWFANNITFKDIADIWIHESFTTYSEGLYVEYYFGKNAANEYLINKRVTISNDKTLIGNYNINDTDYSIDNYGKGAVILHMLRQIVDDDEKWRNILRGLNKDFYQQTVNTQQIEEYISKNSGLELDYFWDQYLRTKQIPVFEYFTVENTLYYRWINSIDSFKMPLKIKLNNVERWIFPETKAKTELLNDERLELKVDRNFYVPVLYSNPK